MAMVKGGRQPAASGATTGAASRGNAERAAAAQISRLGAAMPFGDSALRRGIAPALISLVVSAPSLAGAAPRPATLSPSTPAAAMPAAPVAGAAAAQLPSALPGGSEGTTSDPEAQVQGLVQRVDAAAELVRSQGESAFAALRQRGGPWFQGESYIAVLGSDGRSLVYPPDARGEGLDYRAFQDLGGKPFGRQILAVADSASGRGWVHYQWRRPNPNDRRPVWKATYVERVTAPSGRSYLVLSGLYEPPMARAFVIDAVDAAATRLQRSGREAFAELRDPRGPFFYQDTYVFVAAPDGTLLLNPAFPALEGRNLLQWPDPAERTSAAASLRAVLKDGSTWTTYRWPRPSASRLPESKTTYLRRVVTPSGEMLIVGSGLYAGS